MTSFISRYGLINNLSYNLEPANRERYRSSESLAHGELRIILQKCDRNVICIIVLGSISAVVKSFLIYSIFLLEDDTFSITLEGIIGGCVFRLVLVLFTELEVLVDVLRISDKEGIQLSSSSLLVLLPVVRHILHVNLKHGELSIWNAYLDCAIFEKSFGKISVLYKQSWWIS